MLNATSVFRCQVPWLWVSTGRVAQESEQPAMSSCADAVISRGATLRMLDPQLFLSQSEFQRWSSWKPGGFPEDSKSSSVYTLYRGSGGLPADLLPQ